MAYLPNKMKKKPNTSHVKDNAIAAPDCSTVATIDLVQKCKITDK